MVRLFGATLFGAAPALAQDQGQPAGDAGNAPAAVAPPPLPQQVPPPLPQRPLVTFFVERNGQPAGPFTLEQLAEDARGGGIKRETLVWRSGDPNWVAAKEIAELQPLFAAMPPPVPPAQQWQQYLVGTWETTAWPIPNVSQTTTVQSRPDGSFGRVVTTTGQDISGIAAAISGTWPSRR